MPLSCLHYSSKSPIVNEIDMAVLKFRGKKAKFHLRSNCHQSVDVISI